MRFIVIFLFLIGCSTTPQPQVAAARKATAITWKYTLAMPAPGIIFEVWQSSNLTTWTLKGTTKSPPMNLGNGNPVNMYFRVRACNGSNCSDWGTSSSTPPSPPAYPTKMQLTWVAAASPSVNDYIVFRGTNSGNYTAALDMQGAVTSFLDSTIIPGSPYYYAVKSVAGTEQSTFSNEAFYLPTNAPAPPYAVQILRQ